MNYTIIFYQSVLCYPLRFKYSYELKILELRYCNSLYPVIVGTPIPTQCFALQTQQFC